MRFGKAWENLNPDEAMAQFSKEDLTYYESVFSQPLTSWEDVHRLWDIIPANQKNVKFKYEILITSENHSIIHWKVERFFVPINAMQKIDGVFEIKLDDRGLCIYFKQWRTVKE